MKNFSYIVVCLLVLASCTSHTIYKAPENLIPKEEMIDLLTDMQIAAAAKDTKNKHLQHRVGYMHLVYKKYNIDSARFQESNLYYTSKIDEYDKMLKKVHENLVAMRDEVDKKNAVKDSIKIALGDKPLQQTTDDTPAENLFLYSEPTFKDGPERNIVYENHQMGKQFKNASHFVYTDGKRPYRYTGTVLQNKEYTISAFVKMDDGSKPNVGKKATEGDFCFIIGGVIANKNIVIKKVEGDLYRCSATIIAKERQKMNGIVTYVKHSKKPFRVTGWQLEEGSKLTPYKKSE